MFRSPGFKSQGHMGCCCRGVAFQDYKSSVTPTKARAISSMGIDLERFGIADWSTEKLAVYCARTCGRLVGGETREQRATGVRDAAPPVPSRSGLWRQSPSRLRG